jgi:hypothetical protein
MKNVEPTDDQINDYIISHPGESYYTAREKLRDKAYSEDHSKPVNMDWGTYWKTY